MAYKITIPKRGKHAGEAIIESLDSTSCNTVQEISHHHTVISSTSINHGDDAPVYDSVQVTE